MSTYNVNDPIRLADLVIGPDCGVLVTKGDTPTVTFYTQNIHTASGRVRAVIVELDGTAWEVDFECAKH